MGSQLKDLKSYDIVLFFVLFLYFILFFVLYIVLFTNISRVVAMHTLLKYRTLAGAQCRREQGNYQVEQGNYQVVRL
jgi:hypothetical protein